MNTRMCYESSAMFCVGRVMRRRWGGGLLQSITGTWEGVCVCVGRGVLTVCVTILFFGQLVRRAAKIWDFCVKSAETSRFWLILCTKCYVLFSEEENFLNVTADGKSVAGQFSASITSPWLMLLVDIHKNPNVGQQNFRKHCLTRAWNFWSTESAPKYLSSKSTTICEHF